jgi:diguanylate cyclase (GGDEF)-like protein
VDARGDAELADVERLARVGSWVWWPVDGRVSWSAGLAAVLALPPGRVPSFDALQACLHSGDLPSFRAALDAALATGGDMSGDYRTAAGGWVQCRARLDAGGDDGTPARVVGIFRDITEERVFLDELADAATRDPLTGLLTRFAIADRLEHALDRLRRHEHQVAVMFVDLDGLKSVNDGLGHRVGDAVLRAVGERLIESIRYEDSVGRYGGDEFVVVCEDIQTPEHALLIADRIVERLRLPASAPAAPPAAAGRGAPVEVTTSVGVTAARRGETAAEVLARADAAMYEAKRGGGGRVVFRH